MSLAEKAIGFIGSGAMAEAILKGVLDAKLVNPKKMWASDCNTERLQYFKEQFGVSITENNRELVQNVDVILLAVKPFLLKEVLEEISSDVSIKKSVVSIAAGISTGYISSFLQERVPVVRVMPNTPSLVMEGASAIAPGEFALEENLDIVTSLFNAVGKAIVVQEKDMDAVTGLSGSGPAYMYLIIEALADAGVKSGLPRATALELAAQTMYGAAKMVLQTGEHPAVLKDKVTTPGGTTITGLLTLEDGKLRATLIDAVLAAVKRSKDLGAEIK